MKIGDVTRTVISKGKSKGKKIEMVGIQNGHWKA